MAAIEASLTNLNLVPDEGFVVESNPDSSKKFFCKQCNKICKTERSMKQHIKTVHKALKRTADEGENSEEPQNKINKKEEAIIDDYNLVDMDIPTDTQSQTLNSTVADFCNGLLGHPLLENEETLNLDLSLVNPKYLEEHLHSTVLSDDDVLPLIKIIVNSTTYFC